MPGAVLLIIASMFMATVLSVVAAYREMRGGRRLRVKERLRITAESAVAQRAETILRRSRHDRSRLSVFLQKLSWTDALTRLLLQAGMLSMEAGTFIGIMAITGIVVGAITFLITRSPIWTGVAFVVSAMAPLFWLKMKRKRRLGQFNKQFPDALDLMTSAIRAGHSFAESMHAVSEEMPPPISTEFKIAFDEQNFGLTLEEALHNLTERVPSLDLKFFVTAVLVQRETGGNLTEILDRTAATVRERFKILGQVKTYTAQGRLSGWILGLLPVAIGLAISVINPEYMRMLINDPVGKAMLMCAVFMQILGGLAIKKVITIKV